MYAAGSYLAKHDRLPATPCSKIKGLIYLISNENNKHWLRRDGWH